VNIVLRCTHSLHYCKCNARNQHARALNFIPRVALSFCSPFCRDLILARHVGMFTLALALALTICVHRDTRYLLWKKIEGREDSDLPIEEDEVVEVVEVDTDGDGSESSSDEELMPSDEAFTPLPTSAYVSTLKFDDRKTLDAGKYGAPSDDRLWRWCVRLIRRIFFRVMLSHVPTVVYVHVFAHSRCQCLAQPPS
jgi:hypothetical protein